jgi:hypothetical protein
MWLPARWGSTSLREERKVVTVLFADLVGSTARSERMDPEDVQRLLQPYHAHRRSVLEMQWLFGMSLLPEVCRYLDDPEGPSAVYARLQPFGRLNATLPPELCRGRCPEASGSSPQPWPGGRKPWTTSTSRSG